MGKMELMNFSGEGYGACAPAPTNDSRNMTNHANRMPQFSEKKS
jgi:hypothetical protein